MKKTIVLLPGDGIGPEVTRAAGPSCVNPRKNLITSLSSRNFRLAARPSTPQARHF